MERLKRVLKTMAERLADDRGSVAILVALVIFVCCGMLTMTWNTALLSREKMRLQNAADSAALEHALWQARGMNALQNVNDEAYASAQTAAIFLDSAAKLALEAKAAEFIPYGIGAGLAVYLYAGEVALGSVSAIIAKGTLAITLPVAGTFYKYSSCALGILGAQQFAAENGASPLIPISFDVGSAGGTGGKILNALFGDAKIGFYAFPLSLFSADPFVLPAVKDKQAGAPFHRKNEAQLAIIQASPPGGFLRAIGTGDDFDFDPWVSPTNTVNGKNVPHLPIPATWVAMRMPKATPIAKMDFWSRRDETQRGALEKMPTMAIAAAQCVTGNLVLHNKKLDKKELANRSNWLALKPEERRPAGFGTGATAKLVPVSQSARMAVKGGVGTGAKVLEKLTGFIFWH